MTEPLTFRQQEIAVLVLAGRSNKEIADDMNIQTQVVKNQLTVIYRKLGIRSRVQLATWMLERERQS